MLYPDTLLWRELTVLGINHAWHQHPNATLIKKFISRPCKDE